MDVKKVKCFFPSSLEGGGGGCHFFERSFSPKYFEEKLFKLLIYIYIYICANFENLTAEFYVLYVINIHIKFH